MYFGFNLKDALRDGEDPSLIVSLVQRLPVSSMFVAMQQDSEYWRFYVDRTPEYYVGAGIYDAVNQNTLARGNFKKRAKLDPWPLPGRAIDAFKKEQEKRDTSVAGFFSRLTAMGLPGRKKE